MKKIKLLLLLYYYKDFHATTFTNFWPTFLFFISPENMKKPRGFLMFSGELKGKLSQNGLKWVKY